MKKKLLTLLLAVSLVLVWPAPVRAEEDVPLTAVILFSQEAAEAQVLAALADISGMEVTGRFSQLFPGARVRCSEKGLSAAAALPGVERVVVMAARACAQSGGAPMTESNSLDVMNAVTLAEGYNGDGIVVAVIDSGLRTTHRAFADDSLVSSPALTPAAVADYISGGGTAGRYLSARIPFAYDYYDADSDVTTSDQHGTHVSALAVGYARDETGQVIFRGAAPAAQLLSMKVFSDDGSGANDGAILQAMEDAMGLGADVISLSLGTDSGFAQESGIARLYSQAYQSLRAEGILICCAAGNGSSSVLYQSGGPGLPAADYTDYGTLCAPASYSGATAIAAVNAAWLQGESCLVAGQRQIAYTEGVPDDGAVLPVLEALDGRTLTCAAIDGLGEAADYAGRSVRGKVVLVRRGGITFSEKAAHAAAAGAVACLVYNNEYGMVTPAMERDCAIPCALISREDGAYLLEYIAGGGGSITVRSKAFLAQNSQALTPLSVSAWGPGPNLGFAPALSAPGGQIISASSAGDDRYGVLSGTSMAAPNAAGAMAVVLQALYARDGIKKTEAAALAESLLESSARLLTGSEGELVSPRKQGAGLIDLSAALAADAVVLEPLLELGDSVRGEFLLKLRLKNLGDAPVTLTPSVTVLTEDTEEINGTAYSRMAARDITGGTAVTGEKAVTLQPGTERTITLHLALEEGLRRELSDVFTQGFYVEGYVTCTGGAVPVHASFLGYCGDWCAAPIVEPVDFRAVLDEAARLAEPGAETGSSELPLVNFGANLVYVDDPSSPWEERKLLGENRWGPVRYSDGRTALAGTMRDTFLGGGSAFSAQVCTLRNAEHLIMVVSHERTDEIYGVEDVEHLCRSGVNPLTGQIEASALFTWDGTDAGGRPLPDNTPVSVRFFGWVEGDSAAAAAYSRRRRVRAEDYGWLLSADFDRCLQWAFSLTIDASAPTAAAALSADGHTVTITVQDNQYLAYAAVYDGEDRLLAEKIAADETAGTAHIFTLDISDLKTKTLCLTVGDYAANAMGYTIDLATLAAGQSVTPQRSAAAALTDVALHAWYREAVEFVCLEQIMCDCRELNFRPGEDATRAQVFSALYRAAGSPAVGSQSLPFTDVPISADYRDAIVWAWGEGLVQGYDETTLAPVANVRRQQLAAILYRYAAWRGDDLRARAVLSAFSDDAQVSAWAEEAMSWAVARGYFAGRQDGTLDPKGYLTRAELAQVMERLLAG